MKDRLGDLKRLSQQNWEPQERPELPESLEVQDGRLRDVLLEAKAVRQNIVLLEKLVRRLDKESHYLVSLRRLSSLGRSFSSVTRELQVQAEHVQKGLRRLSQISRELEENQGGVVARVARAQHDSLTVTFQSIMSQFAHAEAKRHQKCLSRLQRQANIVGQQLSPQQVEQLINTGCRLSYSNSSRLEKQRQELVELEGRLYDLHQLFLQVALLVEEQGGLLDRVEAHVRNAHEYTGETRHGIQAASRYKRRRWQCWGCCGTK